MVEKSLEYIVWAIRLSGNPVVDERRLQLEAVSAKSEVEPVIVCEWPTAELGNGEFGKTLEMPNEAT